MSEPIQVDFGNDKSRKTSGSSSQEVLIPPDRSGLKIVIDFIITAVVGAVIYYFWLPPMNFHSPDFYIFWAVIAGVFILSVFLTSSALIKPEYVPYAKKRSKIPLIIVIALVVIFAIGWLVGCQLFRAKSYSSLLSVDENTDFNKSVTVIDSTKDFKNVPMVDSTASETLADKVLGDLASIGLESQFDLATQYSTQINYKGSPCRVYPLSYGNIFKWINNTRDGFPGYVIVNMNTQDTQFVFVDKNQNTENYIKYSPTEHFQKNLKRIVRFKYPQMIIGNISFEADDNGTPYFICQSLKMRIGLVSGTDVQGIVLVNAVTGDMNYYSTDELKTGKSSDGTDLTWIDQVYDVNLLVQQYNYYGTYNNGFWNSVFGQTGVKKTTTGASYLAIDDDVYCYTGVTSVNSDESILGFILINQRTKDALFYSQTGATEVSAMNSANGAVQDKGWQSTFPLLINLDGEATYFMALKDSSNVVKSYAMVNVSNYNIVATDAANGNPYLNTCIDNYVSALKANKNKVIHVDTSVDMPTDSPVKGSDSVKTEGDGNASAPKESKISGVISDILSQNESGSTCYYVKLENSGAWYKISADDYPEAILLRKGQRVYLTVAKAESETGNEEEFYSEVEGLSEYESQA